MRGRRGGVKRRGRERDGEGADYKYVNGRRLHFRLTGAVYSHPNI
jgi:hypothetical protein